MSTTSSETLTCRPCRASWDAATLTNKLRCPQCQGPLLSSTKLQSFKAETLKKLRSNKLNAVLLTLGAPLAILVTRFFLKDVRGYEQVMPTWLLIAWVAIGSAVFLTGMATRRSGIVWIGIVLLQIEVFLHMVILNSETGKLLQLRHEWASNLQYVNLGIVLMSMIGLYSYKAYLRLLALDKRS